MIPSSGLGPVYSPAQLASSGALARTRVWHELVGKLILGVILLIAVVVVIHLLPVVATAIGHALTPAGSVPAHGAPVPVR